MSLNNRTIQNYFQPITAIVQNQLYVGFCLRSTKQNFDLYRELVNSNLGLPHPTVISLINAGVSQFKTALRNVIEQLFKLYFNI